MAGIVPTKSNLMAAQKSLKLAKLGYELMDRKKNILIKELLSLAADAKPFVPIPKKPSLKHMRACVTQK